MSQARNSKLLFHLLTKTITVCLLLVANTCGFQLQPKFVKNLSTLKERNDVLTPSFGTVYQEAQSTPSALDDRKSTICTAEATHSIILSRRNVLCNAMVGTITASSFLLPLDNNKAMAAGMDDTTGSDNSFVQRGNGFAYRFVPPPEMEPGAKPVKTHLFEINWKSTTTPKYTFGITIDPVRINSLKEVSVTNSVSGLVKILLNDRLSFLLHNILLLVWKSGRSSCEGGTGRSQPGWHF